MRLLAVLLLVANALFFVWRFNAQLEDDLAARRRAPPLPPQSPTLSLVRELPELPPAREAPAELAPVQIAQAPVATTAEAEATEAPAGVGTTTPDTETPAEAVAVPGTDAPVAVAGTAAATPSSSSETPPPAPDSSPAQTPAQTDAATPAPAIAAAMPVPADATAALAPAPVTPGAPVPSGVCVKVGPFALDTDAAPLKTWLARRSSRVAVKLEGNTQRPLFGIYLEPRTAEEKERDLRDLAQRGVRDYLPVRRAGVEHAISLGVFSSQENVNRRLAEIEKQGYRPIVVPRRDAGGQRFVEAELAIGFEDPANIPAELLGSASAKPVACPP
ncbi:MAG: hypothetical protein QE509_17145 [Gammaproteobacteria bacterium]|nr:hypothetical protein [Gammaproteobacteria bacterium]